MIPDIKLDHAWMSTFGWLRENIDFPTPQSQTNTIIVPGRNAPIRYAQALGRVSYKPRKFTITLSMLGTRSAFDRMVDVLANTYAGKLTQIITSEDPGLYCVGTLEITPKYQPLTGKGQVTVTCNDGDAYRYHVSETVVTRSGGGVVRLSCDYMPVVPTVTTTSETALSWSIGGDSFSKTVSAGTWTFPELELVCGQNTVTLSGSGTTTFRYREGRL